MAHSLGQAPPSSRARNSSASIKLLHVRGGALDAEHPLTGLRRYRHVVPQKLRGAEHDGQGVRRLVAGVLREGLLPLDERVEAFQVAVEGGGNLTDLAVSELGAKAHLALAWVEPGDHRVSW